MLPQEQNDFFLLQFFLLSSKIAYQVFERHSENLSPRLNPGCLSSAFFLFSLIAQRQSSSFITRADPSSFMVTAFFLLRQRLRGEFTSQSSKDWRHSGLISMVSSWRRWWCVFLFTRKTPRISLLYTPTWLTWPHQCLWCISRGGGCTNSLEDRGGIRRFSIMRDHFPWREGSTMGGYECGPHTFRATPFCWSVVLLTLFLPDITSRVWSSLINCFTLELIISFFRGGPSSISCRDLPFMREGVWFGEP